jgi:hypothetical protein
MDKLVLEEGKFFRNHLGIPVFIALTVAPDTSWYKQGFRFSDHRGSYYTADGSVKNKVFAQLDLITEVASVDLTDDEIDLIDRQSAARIRRMNINDKVQSVIGRIKNLNPFAGKVVA